MLDHLPAEIYFNILSFVPLSDIQNVVPLVNKHSHDIANNGNEGFWKYMCEHKYHFQDGVKPDKQSWNDFASDLDRSLYWDEESLQQQPPYLSTKNRGYSLECNTDGQSSWALANRPLTEKEKYFEIYIDEVSDTAGTAEPSVCVGVTTGCSYYYQPKASVVHIHGYYNTGQIKKQLTNFQSLGTKFGTGDRVGVLLSFEYMTLSFYVNGIFQGTPYVYLSKEAQYPAVSIRGVGTRVSFSMPPKVQPPPMPIR